MEEIDGMKDESADDVEGDISQTAEQESGPSRHENNRVERRKSPNTPPPQEPNNCFTRERLVPQGVWSKPAFSRGHHSVHNQKDMIVSQLCQKGDGYNLYLCQPMQEHLRSIRRFRTPLPKVMANQLLILRRTR